MFLFPSILSIIKAFLQDTNFSFSLLSYNACLLQEERKEKKATLSRARQVDFLAR